MLPEGVVIVALTYGEDRDIPVATVAARRGGAEDALAGAEADAAGADDGADQGGDDAGEDGEEEE